MSNLSSGRLVSRRPSHSQLINGVSPQLWLVPTVPPGPWVRRLPNDVRELWDLPTGSYSAGSLVAVKTGSSRFSAFVELYVYVDNPYNDLDSPDQYNAWDYWKKVDLDWPKTDPTTGRPVDQFLEWYSPLAE